MSLVNNKMYQTEDVTWHYGQMKANSEVKEQDTVLYGRMMRNSEERFKLLYNTIDRASGGRESVTEK